MNTQALTRESTGFFENKKIKTVIYIKNGELIASYFYAIKTYEQLISHELISKCMKYSGEWEKTNKYIYIEPDKEKGWYQPNAGIKLKKNIKNKKS